jgi:hypothetical protein
MRTIVCAVAATMIAAFCCIGCGGAGTRGKPATAVAGHVDMEADSVDVFSQTTNATVRVPYSELRVEFSEANDYESKLEVIGMETGAVATYFFPTTYPSVEREYRDPPPAGYEPLEIELDKKEWRAFFNALLDSGIRQWKREGYNSLSLDGYGWGFDIYTKDGDTLISSHGNDNYPPNKDEWSAFNNVTHGFIKMMRERKQKQREMEYANRFGKSISEYERSIVIVFYDCGTTKSVSVRLSASGEVVFYSMCTGGVRLNVDDWLNIINALNNIAGESISKTDVDTMVLKDTIRECVVSVYDSPSWRNRFANNKDSINTVKPLPVSEKLKDIMDGIEARTRNACDNERQKEIMDEVKKIRDEMERDEMDELR